MVKNIIKKIIVLILILLVLLSSIALFIPVRVWDKENPQSDVNGWIEVPLWKKIIFNKKIVVSYDRVIF